VRALQRQIILGIAAGVVGLIAAAVVIAFLSTAAFYAFAAMMEPHWAALATAGAIALGAALIIVTLRVVARPPRAPAQPGQRASSPQDDIAMQLGSLLGGEARGFATKHKAASIVGSLALGFAIGMSPALRDLLRRGL
jgi:hypothetical protein